MECSLVNFSLVFIYQFYTSLYTQSNIRLMFSIQKRTLLSLISFALYIKYVQEKCL